MRGREPRSHVTPTHRDTHGKTDIMTDIRLSLAWPCSCSDWVYPNVLYPCATFTIKNGCLNVPSTPCPRASKWSLQALACWPAEKPLGTTISALTQAATDRYDTELAPAPRGSVGGKSPCPGDHLLRPPSSMVLGSLHLRLRRRRRAQRWCGVGLLLSLYDLSQTSPWQGMLVLIL